METSSKCSAQFKAVVVLCCMIAIIGLSIGGFGVYLYLQANSTDHTVEPEVTPTPTEAPVVKTKNCSQTLTYEIISKVERTDQTGDYQYVVASQFQSDPVMLKVSKVIYDTLEVGSSYEFSVTYTIDQEDENFYDGTYSFTNVAKTDKVGLEQVETSPICE